MRKQWTNVHKILHCIGGSCFMIAWYIMVHIGDLIRSQCSALPWPVKIMYSFAVEIAWLVLIPIIALAILMIRKNISESTYAFYWSTAALLFIFFAAFFLAYIEFLPIFDCGFGAPMQTG